MNNEHVWVVVADKGQAKIYQVTKFPKLEEVANLAHPECRLHNQDLISSKPGRTFQSFSTSRSAYQPENEPKAVEAMKFAAEVSEFLTNSVRKGKFTRMYLIAEPSFLGLLRKQVSSEVKKTILGEIPKDLTNQGIRVVEQQLMQV